MVYILGMVYTLYVYCCIFVIVNDSLLRNVYLKRPQKCAVDHYSHDSKYGSLVVLVFVGSFYSGSTVMIGTSIYGVLLTDGYLYSREYGRLRSTHV